MSTRAVNPSPHAGRDALSPAPALDYDLAQRAAQGDMRAFEEIYLRYNRRVYGLCLRMMRSTPEAEDMTQEIFIKLFKKIGGFRGESSLMTWLHRLSVNEVLMHFRKNIVQREHTTEDGETPEPKLRRVETASGRAEMVDRLALERAVAQLPPGYREVFILHDVEGYEHPEIARMRQSSVGTSKSQLHKARKKLRELLEPKFPAPEQQFIEAP